MYRVIARVSVLLLSAFALGCAGQVVTVPENSKPATVKLSNTATAEKPLKTTLWYTCMTSYREVGYRAGHYGDCVSRTVWETDNKSNGVEFTVMRLRQDRIQTLDPQKFKQFLFMSSHNLLRRASPHHIRLDIPVEVQGRLEFVPTLEVEVPLGWLLHFSKVVIKENGVLYWLVFTIVDQNRSAGFVQRVIEHYLREVVQKKNTYIVRVSQ